MARSRFGRAIAVLVAAIVVSSAVIGIAYYLSPATAPVTYPSLAANLTVNNATTYSVGTGFLGVNLRADFPMGAQGSAVTATPARLVRWPGGALADRFDPLALNGTGLIYGTGGSPSPAPTTAADFVRWCESAGCRAIVTIPGEVDQPSYAQREVSYFESTLGFRPAYWEVGNEPALWPHWGYPWTDWQPGQNSTPSPLQYAQELAAYISAIRTVDPLTPILGLPGTGTGGIGETSWIEATVAVNGPNLSALAIHVYPAGTYSVSASAADLFTSLADSDSLLARVAADENAIRLACSSCRIAILADEVGVESSATGAPVSFPWVPFEAVEIAQGVESGVTGMLFWTSQGSYPGSWLSGSGSPQLTYGLFETLPSTFPTVAHAITVGTAASGVYAIQFGPDALHPSLVVLVNANVTYTIDVNLSSVVPPGLSGSVLTWSNSTAFPVSHSWNPASTAEWSLPPDSLLEWVA